MIKSSYRNCTIVFFNSVILNFIYLRTKLYLAEPNWFPDLVGNTELKSVWKCAYKTASKSELLIWKIDAVPTNWFF